jgi:hypothetical protein
MINLSAMDMGLSIGFFAIFALVGSLNYATVFNVVPFMNETTITIISLLLLSGAMAKSAQIPLHSWLPGSMEGKRINIFYKNLIIIIIIINFYIFILFKWSSTSFLSMSIILPIIPSSSKNVKDCLIGYLIADGHLRVKHKNGIFTGKANFSMTLKSYDYAIYLKEQIYSTICTSTPIRPWPNPKTGKIATQYAFNSKLLPLLTSLHKEWYNWSKELTKFIKIVPLNIFDLITSIGLAHWIMGDGYWSEDTLFLCTDNFTLKEVELLIDTLNKKFDLISSKNVE